MNPTPVAKGMAPPCYWCALEAANEPIQHPFHSDGELNERDAEEWELGFHALPKFHLEENGFA